MIENNNVPLEPQIPEGALTSDQYKDKNFTTLLQQELQDNTEQKEEIQNPFPVTSLPEPLQSFVNEISNVYSVPPEFPACAALSATGASIQKKIHLHNGKYTNYPQLWLMLVAPPGIGKSEPLDIAFRKLTEKDKTSYENYSLAMENWKADCISARKNKTVEPEKPVYKQLLINDFTPESLFDTIFKNNNSIALFRDELSGWFSDFGRYNKSGEMGHYLSMFNNADFKINRKTQEPLLISKPFFQVIGSIQPDILSAALKNQHLIENGFASRFLFALPKRIKKPYYSDLYVDQEIIRRYNELIEHLQKIPYVYEPVKLSIEAKRLFVDFANDLTDKSNNCNENYLKAVYAKMEIHVLRIAIALHVVESVYNDELWDGNKILPHTMQNAINIANYFIGTSLILYNQNDISNYTLTDAIRLIYDRKGIINKQAFADSIGVSRQFISKLCKP